MDVRCEQYNTTFHATRACVRVALVPPDTNAHSMLINAHTHLHYPSQNQWLRVRGIQEPPHRAPSGAPTCMNPSSPAWGVRLTQRTIAVAFLAQAPYLAKPEMIIAENAR